MGHLHGHLVSFGEQPESNAALPESAKLLSGLGAVRASIKISTENQKIMVGHNVQRAE